MLFKLFSSNVYCIIEHYLSADYPFFRKLNVVFIFQIKSLKKKHTILFRLFGIPELLMSIVSCHGFVKDTKSAVIL